MNALEVPRHLEIESWILSRDLRAWADRDDSRPQAGPRQAATRVMQSIDRALAELNELRAQMVTEIRQADDAAAARVDAMLAGRKDGAR